MSEDSPISDPKPVTIEAPRKHQPFVPENMKMKEFTWRAVLLGLVLSPRATAAETVPLAAIVPPYIGDGLELAVIPSPQEAVLSATLFELAEVLRHIAACIGPFIPAASAQILARLGEDESTPREWSPTRLVGRKIEAAEPLFPRLVLS